MAEMKSLIVNTDTARATDVVLPAESGVRSCDSGDIAALGALNVAAQPRGVACATLKEAVEDIRIEAFNRSLADRVDTEAIMAHFSPCFVAVGPQGVKCGQNDETFAEVLQQGYGFYREIGLRQMTLRGVITTPIDEGHQVARVSYRAAYEKRDGEQVDLDFEVSYMLAARADSFEIFAFVAGDEMALYRKHGLVPDSTSS